MPITINEDNLGEETLRILREQGVFRQLTVSESYVLEHLECGPLTLNGPFAIRYKLELGQLHYYHYTLKSVLGYTITDTGRAALAVHKEQATMTEQHVATVEVTAIAVLVIEKPTVDQQALTNLINALAAFEVELEEAFDSAKRDYENTGPQMSYSEGLDWGHKWGLEIATARWQNCKEAIAKIGGDNA